MSCLHDLPPPFFCLNIKSVPKCIPNRFPKPIKSLPAYSAHFSHFAKSRPLSRDKREGFRILAFSLVGVGSALGL